MKKQLIYVVAWMILACSAMALVDGVIQPGYWIKSLSKWILFVMIPLLLFAKHLKGTSLFKVSRNQLKISIIMGVSVYALILIAYGIVSIWVDFSPIVAILDEQVAVNASNFLFVSTYIALVNSAMEEFFFRGFGYLRLKTLIRPSIAGWISSLLFAFYHVAMMIGWFHWSLFLLIMISLVVAGWLFIWLNRQSTSFFNSWFVHMFANLAINTVGWLLLLK